ncbi:hypothetical protein NEDG_02185 [Nematocida displodere]|uniref:Uncharacterized protein n=1 Tax=Nematocida displodere TaxID=1805483 RepID=A0A177EGX8_9MICR|nr:hypothetical protein NEDG_02185 [Nematocida displodere]
MRTNQTKEVFPLFATDDVNLSNPEGNLSSGNDKDSINGKTVSAKTAIINTVLYGFPGSIAGPTIWGVVKYFEEIGKKAGQNIGTYKFMGGLFLRRSVLPMLRFYFMFLYFTYLAYFCFERPVYPVISRFVPFKPKFTANTRIIAGAILFAVFLGTMSFTNPKKAVDYFLRSGSLVFVCMFITLSAAIFLGCELKDMLQDTNPVYDERLGKYSGVLKKVYIVCNILGIVTSLSWFVLAVLLE